MTQFQLALIAREVDGEVIHLRTKDGYINATAMCKSAGKLLADYTRLKTTQDFLMNYHAIWGFPYRS
ncbi:KilA-N domain [Escherichia coli]|nr:KilA-N domain-containing protein [Enterobacter hormaechei subsp. hoffmannii]STI55160.1 KilA-N domain [Escherichia coli]